MGPGMLRIEANQLSGPQKEELIRQQVESWHHLVDPLLRRTLQHVLQVALVGRKCQSQSTKVIDFLAILLDVQNPQLIVVIELYSIFFFRQFLGGRSPRLANR